MEYKKKKLFEEYKDILTNNLYLNLNPTSKDIVTLKIFSLDGLSFSYPNDWTVKTETLEEGFQINIEKEEQLMTIVYIRHDISNRLSLEEWYQTTINSLENDPTYANIEFASPYSDYFNHINALSANFQEKLSGTYGKQTLFVSNDKAIVILKYSNSQEKLLTEFQTIEDSFNID